MSENSRQSVPGWRSLAQTLGPGILWAGAAIGVSHLVQSTRAGAIYGLSAAWIVLLAMAMKYPFFEFPYRYAAATGKSLLHGYRAAGRWMLWTFFAFALVSGVLSLAAITAVTAGITGHVFGAAEIAGVPMTMFAWSVVVLVPCIVLRLIGRYALLDATVKCVMAVLTVSTLAALIAACAHGSRAAPGFAAPSVWTPAGIGFILVFSGWMPTPMDGALWPSIWAMDRRRQTGHQPALSETLADFHLGYIGSAVLSLCFLGLGALIMFGTGRAFPASGIAFADTLLDLYAQALGAWSRPLVGAAALTCMFSTSLTCFDGYARTLQECLHVGLGRDDEAPASGAFYWAFAALFTATTLIIIGGFMQSMLALVGLAMLMAFLSAPVLAWLNFHAVAGDAMPEAFRPARWLRVWSWLGLAYFVSFTVLFIIYQAGLIA